MMKLLYLIALLVIAIIAGVDAAGFVKFEGIKGESTDHENAAFDDAGEFWFTDLEPDLSFEGGGICPRGKESGEKAGTEDINIGVGELNMTKTMDSILSPLLIQRLHRTLAKTCEVCYTASPSAKRFSLGECFLHVKFKKCFLKSYEIVLKPVESTGTDIPTEHISLNFQKIEATYNATGDGPNFPQTTRVARKTSCG